MSNILDSSKSQLGKLLASENIRIEHQKVHGPYFDVKQRLLVLPIWKDMNADLYDLMIGHEVGHALFTPTDGWMDEVKAMGSNFKSFLNIVEDARIEKKMKRKYPGLRKPMYNGYTELVERKFFGVPMQDMKHLPFADRLNVYFKLGARADVSFNEKEQNLVDRIEECETWEEVMELSKELYEAAKDEKSELDDLFDDLMEAMDALDEAGSGQPGSEGESSDGQDFQEKVQDVIDKLRDAGKNEMADALENASARALDKLRDWMQESKPTSITEDAFRSKENTLLDEDALPIAYVNWPKVDPKNWVVPHKVTYKHMVFEPLHEEKRQNIYNKFMGVNKRYISYLVKEFELRRNAKQFAKAKVSKTGKLDVDKVWSYKLSEDLFLQSTVVPKGKNHGMLMVIDLSSSMSENISGTIEQVVALAMFCRKVNIPFDVYGFVDNGFYTTEFAECGIPHIIKDRNKAKNRDLFINNATFRLKQLLNYKMKLSEFNHAIKSLLLLANAFETSRGYYYYSSNAKVPTSMQLGGTPLNETIVVLSGIAEQFKKETKIEVLNTIILTDGDASYNLAYVNNDAPTGMDYGHKFILEHGNNQVSLNNYRGDMTDSLLEMYKMVTGSRNIGIYLMAGNNYKSQIYRKVGYADGFDQLKFDKQYKEEFGNHRFFGVKSKGYDVYYMVPGSDLNIEEVNMSKVLHRHDAKKGDLLRAFKKMQNTKMVSRVFLNQFVQYIS
jgi:hypothetical protein